MTQFLLTLLDIVATPFVALSAFTLKLVRRAGVDRLRYCKQVLLRIGVFPITDHYYEPLFNPAELQVSKLSEPRQLPAIDWNDANQLDLLSKLEPFASEFAEVSQSLNVTGTYFRNNSRFGAGDAEYWYCIIRHLKPKRIVEVGSGFSTMLAARALLSNHMEDTSYTCTHICIEPYEAPWLESANVEVVRHRLQDVDPKLFASLDVDDILFIDSSHIIRPQGDVVTTMLQILPRLNPGVVVHIHDIFSPRDYPKKWVVDEVRLWNEQYMVEAFLSHNQDWQVVGALNYLRHQYCSAISKSLGRSLNNGSEPGSLYLQRSVAEISS
jgi:predicted O-methyltransferase YrrM